MPAAQVHDFNPGILPNGLFWTMAIPDDAFYLSSDGNHAALDLHGLPMPNTFFYANNVSVSGALSAQLEWHAVGPRERRGLGRTVPPTDFGAFQGRFSEASCVGTGQVAHTGFSFESGVMDASGFWAQMGEMRNGTFLS